MRIACIVLVSLLPFATLASPPEPQDAYLSRCQVTPEVKPKDRYPGRAAIVPSNKLALPAGKAVFAKGQLVFISGRVFDENCVPISDAIVEIWHASPEGKYVTANLGERMSPYPYFTGSGRAITDNLGRYNFVSLYPGTYGHIHRAPHVHIHVIHKGFKTLDTELYFGGDTRNEHDPKLAKLKNGKRDLVIGKVWPRTPDKPEDGIAVQWDLTLKGKNAYRHF